MGVLLAINGALVHLLQELMGHASITETFDRYGHLFPGTKDEAAALLDAYLELHARGVQS